MSEKLTEIEKNITISMPVREWQMLFCLALDYLSDCPDNDIWMSTAGEIVLKLQTLQSLYPDLFDWKRLQKLFPMLNVVIDYRQAIQKAFAEHPQTYGLFPSLTTVS